MRTKPISALQHLWAVTRQVRPALVVGVLLVAAPGISAGAQSATQVVRFSVIAQHHADVAPVEKPLSLRSTTASVAASALTLSTNDATLKVTASLDHAMSPGTSLSLIVGDRMTGVDSAGRQLGTTAMDVLTTMTPTEGSRIPIAYRVSATSDDAPRAGEQRLVTYTIITAP